MNSLYKYTLFNCDKLSYTDLTKLSLDLYLNWLAEFIKVKFNDSRSVDQIVQMIKEECLFQGKGLA